MQDFKKLHVWKKAHALALNARGAVWQIRGDAALKNQLVRAAMSIPTNIVEGRAKQSDAEFARFLGIALGSASELEYHLMVARDTGALRRSDALSLLAQTIEVRKMLHGFLDRITSTKSP